MSFLRGLGRTMLSLGVFLLLSAWLSIAVLQMTLLNRQVVMGWLQQSGIYQNVLTSLPTQLDEASGQSFVTSADLKAALIKTFPPAYVQEQTEVALNATYDWVEGKKSKIDFSIRIDKKKNELSANVAKQIEPKVAALPRCTSQLAPSSEPTCLPQGLTAAEFAAQLTRFDSSNEANTLIKPLTPETFTQNANLPNMGWLPGAVAQFNTTAIVLPLVAIAMVVGFVFLNDSKLRGLATIGRRTFFHFLFVSLLGLALWYFGGTIQVGSQVPADGATQQAALDSFVDPLIRILAPAIGQVLAMLAAIPAIVGGGAWLTAHLLQKRQQTNQTHFSHQPDQLEPKPPTQPDKPEGPKPPTQPILS